VLEAVLAPVGEQAHDSKVRADSRSDHKLKMWQPT
jgi:hypothetical protein